MCTDTLTRRGMLLGAAATVTALSAPAPASAAAPRGRRLLDLTYAVTTTFAAFAPGEEAARRTSVTIEDDGYYMQEWRILEHFGTHVDAPGHFTPGGRTADELRLAELISPAVVIDVAARAARDPDTTVTVADLQRHEHRYGRIPPGAAVLMHSGWGARAGDPYAYRNDLHFPGFSLDACEWLMAKRRIRALGVDTLSIDPGVSTGFETHLALTGADRYGVENLAHVGRLPPRGATLTVGLIPYEAGSGGQARVFASW